MRQTVLETLDEKLPERLQAALKRAESDNRPPSPLTTPSTPNSQAHVLAQAQAATSHLRVDTRESDIAIAAPQSAAPNAAAVGSTLTPRSRAKLSVARYVLL